MLTDKDIKKKLKEEAKKTPEKFYPVNVLKELGFIRYPCKSCGRFFWAGEEREFCDEPECREKFGLKPYGFIGNPPTTKKFDYSDTWFKAWVECFKKNKYTPINRYPVTARWRDDTDFVQASIYDFQPYVVSGQVEPPANPLLVPQFCVRFNDIENVGISGRHFTGFIMVGQHVFNFPGKHLFFKEEALRHIYDYLSKGIGLPNKEIIFHEDAWAGGGNSGPSLEFFSRGLEIGNQVYMQYKNTPEGVKPLDVTVIDMGAGLERSTWLMNGTPTAYDTVFPSVLKRLHALTGEKIDSKIWEKFAQHSGILNVDEVDLDKSWEIISKKIQIPVVDLKKEIYKSRAIYSISDHTRSLLVAIKDGAFPSNISGGYNLRNLLRRCWLLMKENKWEFDLREIFYEHSKEFGKIYPELPEGMPLIEKILNVEERKYKQTRESGIRIVEKKLGEKIEFKDLLLMYESQGIQPELIEEVAKEKGVTVEMPADFYMKLDELKNKKEGKKEKTDLTVTGLSETELLFYKDMYEKEFDAKILKVLGEWVVLDKTLFYPEGGGQDCDFGELNNIKVIDVQKFGGVVAHKVDNCFFKEGQEVHGKINWDRRYKLMQHHTSTHIINAAARMVLGDHINQAGAHKSEDSARIDLTHWEIPLPEQITEIEKIANQLVCKNIPLKIETVDRNTAEKEHGFRIYQGGAVPGKFLKIVEIPGYDIEACGGTHLKSTGEACLIKITGVKKIQDGIIRIEFSAGKNAEKCVEKSGDLFKETIQNLGEYGKGISEKEPEEQVKKASKVFRIQEECLPRTIQRFIKEWQEFQKGTTFESELSKAESLEQAAETLFAEWKKLRKLQK